MFRVPDDSDVAISSDEEEDEDDVVIPFKRTARILYAHGAEPAATSSETKGSQLLIDLTHPKNTSSAKTSSSKLRKESQERTSWPYIDLTSATGPGDLDAQFVEDCSVVERDPLNETVVAEENCKQGLAQSINEQAEICLSDFEPLDEESKAGSYAFLASSDLSNTSDVSDDESCSDQDDTDGIYAFEADAGKLPNPYQFFNLILIAETLKRSSLIGSKPRPNLNLKGIKITRIQRWRMMHMKLAPRLFRNTIWTHSRHPPAPYRRLMRLSHYFRRVCDCLQFANLSPHQFLLSKL